MNLLRTDPAVHTSDGLVITHSNSLFAWVVISFTVVLLIVIALGQWKHRRFRLLDHSIPVICCALVIGLSFHAHSLTAHPGKPYLERTDATAWSFLSPKRSRWQIADIEALRLDVIESQATRNGSPIGLPKKNYFVRLSLSGGRRVELPETQSRNRATTLAIARLLATFIEDHEAFRGKKLYTPGLQEPGSNGNGNGD